MLKDPKRELTDEIVATGIDADSRNRVAEWLREKNCVVRFTQPSCCFDLYVIRPNGEFYLIEVKNHPKTPSTKYKDNGFEKLKYNKLLEYAPPHKIYFFNIWCDNKMKISRLDWEFVEEKHWCPKTTDFANKQSVNKDWVQFTEFQVKDIPPYK